MTLTKLLAVAHSGRVDELNLLSHEGAMYFVEVVIDGQRRLLKQRESDVRGWAFRSLNEARHALAELPMDSINLVHLNVCDEIGPTHQALPLDAAAMRLSVPLRP